MSSAKQTQDHDTIRTWIEKRGGKPAVVKDTADDGSGVGVLRVKFDNDEDDLREIEWETFFETFDKQNLSFLYQEKTDSGDESRFSKFVSE
ncbi:MAG: hypothetical protein CME36_20790 [unclassified Hahellaceae]|nr:hypothetical protein [Hahellaceae bacterium]|tara:strand:+ start:115883 stop:116155 length:273 start_codon:yes stop_codon:yes gene_type:complete